MHNTDAPPFLRKGLKERTASNKRMFTRSFSIETDTIEKLDACSKKKDTTTNSLVNSILTNYVNNTISAEMQGFLIFSKKMLAEILVRMDNESVKAAAKNAGKNAFQKWCLENDCEPSIEAFRGFVRRLCNWAKWASYDDSCRTEKIIIKFYHDYDDAWSSYLQSYLDAALTIACDGKINKYRIALLEKTLVITISLI